MSRFFSVRVPKSVFQHANGACKASGEARTAKPGLAIAALLISLVASAVEAAPVQVVPGSPAAYIFFPKQLNP